MTDRSAALTFLTGEVFDGTSAAEMGLVTKAVPEDEPRPRACARCGAGEGHPQGLRETSYFSAGRSSSGSTGTATTSRSSPRAVFGLTRRRPR
jgi:enoyl-CoA hydratase/carnithine racemase